MKKLSQETKLFITMFLAACLPYLLYGFRYFPILDDYIQYWCYPAHNDFSHIYLTIGTLSTRPLASLLDVAFWGQLWDVMWLALLLITVLHFFTVFFFYQTGKKFGVTLSPLLLLIYLLLPLGMEGRYWLSASSRIVCGMFFASLSLWFLGGFLKEKQSLRHFLPFAFFQLISCGFYESASVFSVTAAVLLSVIAFWQERKKSFILVPLTSVTNIGLMFLYYRIFANLGLMGSRASGMELSALPANCIEILRQLCEVFALFFDAIIIGSLDGIKLLWSKGFGGILLFFAITLLSLVMIFFSQHKEKPNKVKSLCFAIFGLILFFAPLAPNAMAQYVWITNRSMFTSILGMALILEPVFGAIKNRPARAAILCTVAFLFMTATVNEYDVYQRTNALDSALLDQVIAQMDEDALAGRRAVCVPLEKEVQVPQNAFYKDHVKSVFDSDWATIGGIRARMKSLNVQYIQPLYPGQKMTDPNSQIIYINVE